MAKYRADLQDIYFNLFDLFKVQEHGDMTEQDAREIIDSLNKFVENEVYPSRQEADHIGVKLADKQVKVPECFKSPQKQFYENGWYALGYPEEIGGMPAPHAVALACTSLVVGANVAFSMYYGLSKGAQNVILAIGDEAQKNLYVPPMMEGRWGGTMCLTEANAGSDVGASKTSATKQADGSYLIKGTKIFISSGDNDLYENIIHLVLARTPGAPEGTKGLSLFIVPKYRINKDGSNGASNDVVCSKIEEKMGLHASSTCVMNFGEANQCQGFLIGEELEGMANMFIMMNEARLLCGLQGESQANLVYELTHQYASERTQFGTEIKNHPDVKRTLLRMRSMSRGLRMLNFYTATLFERLEKGEKEIESLIALLTPVCKSYASDEGFNVSVDAIQLHGGYGFCSEYGIEQFARDIKIATIYEGTNGIQAIDFVMRKILKDQGQTFMGLGKLIQADLMNPAAQDWKEEQALLGTSLQKAQEILSAYGEMAKKKDFDRILTSTTDFLSFSGNLIVAWLHLKSAIAAKEALSLASGEEKQFLQSKIEDYHVFCRLFVVKNLGLAKSILGFQSSLQDIDV